MARWMRAPAAAALLVAAALAGCDRGPPAGTASASASVSAPGTAAAAGTPAASTGGRCPVTRPRRFRPPPGVARDDLFGSEASYGNGQLWVGGLGDGGVIEAGPDDIQPDGSVGTKFGWWREAAGSLRISGRRLDGPAPPLRADVPDGYGPEGFQASGVYFPTAGCWEVSGTTGRTTLTFVTLVRTPR